MRRSGRRLPEGLITYLQSRGGGEYPSQDFLEEHRAGARKNGDTQQSERQEQESLNKK